MDSATIVTPLSGVELTHLTYALVVVATFFGVSSLYLAVRLHRLNLLYKTQQHPHGADNALIGLCHSVHPQIITA